MTTMTRGLSASRRAVAATTTRSLVAQSVATLASVGRTAQVAELGERRALAREHAWIEAAASAALRGRA